MIGRVSPFPNAPRAPYSLEPTAFRFPAMAMMAGRAPLGGPRELALACFLVARIVADCVTEAETLSPEQRASRAHGAKQWLGGATLPHPIKGALVRLAESTAATDRRVMRSALDYVMTVTANQRDSGARLEFGRLAQAIAE